MKEWVERELVGKRPYHHGEPMWRFYLRASIQVAVVEHDNPVRWWLWRAACGYVDWHERKYGAW